MATPTTTVIREVATNVWIFSAPYSRSGLVPIGGRSTAIKLSNGGVWVMASTALNEPTFAKLAELGDVQYTVSGDPDHHDFLGEFKKAYPSAKLIGMDQLAKKRPDLTFDGAYGRDSPETKFGFEDDIKAEFFAGHMKGDVAFFHPASKSLIEADLLVNLPPTEQYSLTGKSGRVPIIGGLGAPHTRTHRFIAWMTTKDRSLMKESCKRVATWDFERIIPCHGDVIETGAKEAWDSVFGQFLD